MVDVVQLVRASDCGSECRRFESDTLHFFKRVIRQRVTLFLIYLYEVALLHFMDQRKNLRDFHFMHII